MPVIGLRRLSRETRDVVAEMEDTGEPVIVARRGKPVGVLLPATPEMLREAAMAISPDSRAAFEEADAEFAAGTTRSLDDVIADLDGEPFPAGLEEVEADGPADPQVVQVEGIDLGRFLGEVSPRLPGEVRVEGRELNAKLIEGLVEHNVENAIVEVKAVNKALVALSGGPDHLSGRRYIKLLKRVVDAEPAMKKIFDFGPGSYRFIDDAEAPAEAEAEAAPAVEAPEEMA